MKTIVKEYHIFKYNELCDDAKERAIYNYIDDMANDINWDTINKNSNLYKAIKKAESMQTPWFTYNYIYEYCEKEIMKNIRKLEFYEDGGLYYE